MKPHPLLFDTSHHEARNVVQMPPTREQRDREMTRFLRWFGFWWTLGWFGLIGLALAYMSTQGGK